MRNTKSAQRMRKLHVSNSTHSYIDSLHGISQRRGLKREHGKSHKQCKLSEKMTF